MQNKVKHKLAAIVQQIWCVDYCLAPAKNKTSPSVSFGHSLMSKDFASQTRKFVIKIRIK